MKILFVSGTYPTEKYPQNGIFEFDQAKAISNQGHEVVFVSADVRSILRWRKWGFERLERDGVSIYGINYPLGRVPKKILFHFSVRGLKLFIFIMLLTMCFPVSSTQHRLFEIKYRK